MGLGLAVGWVGYTLAYFGWASLKGPGVGLLDLVIPGRTVIIYGSLPASDNTVGPHENLPPWEGGPAPAPLVPGQFTQPTPTTP